MQVAKNRFRLKQYKTFLFPTDTRKQLQKLLFFDSDLLFKKNHVFLSKDKNKYRGKKGNNTSILRQLCLCQIFYTRHEIFSNERAGKQQHIRSLHAKISIARGKKFYNVIQQICSLLLVKVASACYCNCFWIPERRVMHGPHQIRQHNCQQEETDKFIG